ncbi:MAG: hypothetical protein K2P58_06350 [Hyphomonadaceae bacterium]|nr:hypothetical protein [Hyphomonadaceae bacterium]
MVSIPPNLSLRLLGGSTSVVTGLDADLLTAAMRARTGAGPTDASVGQDPNAPIAPIWTPGLSPGAAAMAERALANRPFFEVDTQVISDLGATGDYRRLFALHTGISMLQGLATRAETKDLSVPDRARVAAQFARGLSELESFFAKQRFEDLRLVQGERVDTTQTTLALPVRTEDYSTGLIHRGGLFDTVKGLDPNAQFTIRATSATGTVRSVAIDLSDMGSTPRTLGSVLSHINAELSAAGAASRLEALDLTPKQNTIVVAGRTITSRYAGPKQYGLKVDVRAGETVAFQPGASEPAFYALGATQSGPRLIKLSDVGGEGGQPVWMTRPGATASPIGPHVATGWFGPGVPYASAPSGAWEHRTNALMSAGANNFETALRVAGEAVLKLETSDGRFFTITSGWRAEDAEAWRTRAGESSDRAILDDLAERLTQLAHEQGVPAGVEVWENGGQLGLSVFTSDGLKASGLDIGGRATAIDVIEPPNMAGGLREGVFARRFDAAGVASTSQMFVGDQTFVISLGAKQETITIAGGAAGIDSATLAQQLNEALRDRGVAAAASLVDVAGSLTFRLDALHEITSVSARLNGVLHTPARQAPGGWATGGLPAASPGQPFGDALRSYAVGSPPLLAHTGALDIAIVVQTPTGSRTVSVSVSALERANDPDPAPGEWSATFQTRLSEALNEAGVYVGSLSADLTQWRASEGAGHRIESITINGGSLTLSSPAPSFALGGAFSATRSSTSAEAATGVADTMASLVSDPNVSITFDTVWGSRTVSAALQVGDARSLESAALRLNEALAAQGYDLGLAAVALSGGGAGLRVVIGGSHSVRTVTDLNLGGVSHDVTLDPIDSASAADDPIGAARVADRAARGGSVSMVIPAQAAFVAPSANASAWFPGRAFDVGVGAGTKVATARAVAAGAEGAVYVLADLSGDSAVSAIKGARDVALFKYDSAGRIVFSRMLGASETASGFALAVAGDGKVAIAGSVEGTLVGAQGQGGADSFVTLLDADGEELWTARRGANASDQANAVAFAPDGSVIVAGRTQSSIGNQIALGASDAYLRGYSASGLELFTRQFGTGADDAATALLVRDAGGGSFDVISAGVENNRGVVRRFTYAASAGLSEGPSRDIGNFHQGSIHSMVSDGAALFVGGEIGADRLTLGIPARPALAAQEGFVARLHVDLSSTLLDRATYLGSAQNDSVKSLAIAAGAVYAAGVSGGVIAGQGAANRSAGFVARLDQDGEAAWMRTFGSSGGSFSLAGVAVSPDAASALDVLGLPIGVVAARDAGLVASRSAVRVGDEFRIGVDGGRMATIRIQANDTLASLVAGMQRAVGSAGRVTVLREAGFERLKITPNGDSAIRLEAGREGRDGLAGLGIRPGLVAQQGGAGETKSFGLELLTANLRIDAPASITRTKAQLSAALSLVRRAYEALVNPNAKELTDEEKALEQRRNAVGEAPAHLRAQLANYQAALARLGGL